ncbi:MULTISPECIES: hypothetical protein [Parachlamydia]|jgi:hypothetical protein|uniref:hypothetical protein n=1 Tax=Parachlamydia TaxID=83551 RepID=UPI0001C17852|nr:hypothetical protein [Parachlamydia acanthamoebae]EFB42243.1 hypothetical protein pah_c013o002 [Parachlamydia acanthamoebae str. Hall's coccus]
MFPRKFLFLSLFALSCSSLAFSTQSTLLARGGEHEGGGHHEGQHHEMNHHENGQRFHDEGHGNEFRHGYGHEGEWNNNRHGVFVDESNPAPVVVEPSDDVPYNSSNGYGN